MDEPDWGIIQNYIDQLVRALEDRNLMLIQTIAEGIVNYGDMYADYKLKEYAE